MKKIELLAPAGDLARLKVAIEYGADAVYLGGEQFSLRSAAVNFNDDELAEGIRFAHERGKKVYIALNIIPHNRDLESIVSFAEKVQKLGADAVIVSDLGVMELLREHVPNLPIHISTQASVTNYMTVKKFVSDGAERVVLARELSLGEIAEIKEKTGAELEVFCHGAVCMSYSGRCLLSNYLANRDSNMGQCAQPCRWQYYVMEEKRPGMYMPVVETERGTFVFNAKDMCLIEHIDKLIAAGVDSLKIEGRIKTAYYVATVVKSYRRAIDAYYENSENWYKGEYLTELKKVSHRKYDTGFFFGMPEEIYSDGSYIRNYDVIADIVKSAPDEGRLYLSLLNKVTEGETLEVMEPQGDFWYLKAEDLKDENGEPISTANHATMLFSLKCERNVSPYAFIRRKRPEAADPLE